MKDTGSRMSLFFAGLGRATNEEGRETMKLRDKEEFRNKRSKTLSEFGQQKRNANRSSCQKQKGQASSCMC